jgi:hypothetical protein
MDAREPFTSAEGSLSRATFIVARQFAKKCREGLIVGRCRLGRLANSRYLQGALFL